jgi:hypothetical protein
MSKKAPHPAALGEPNRARETEGFGDAFNPENSNTHELHQGEPVVAGGIALHLQYPQLSGRGLAWIEAAMRHQAERALESQGLRAFECPKSSAGFHEAGHCVIGAVDGEVPSRAAIWSIRKLGRLQWIGMTYGLPPLWVDDRTDPQTDLRHARTQMAGVIAEAAFDPDFRPGSSLDETAVAAGIVHTAAFKMRCEAKALWDATRSSVERELKAHEGVVRAIADQLMRKGSIEGPRLQILLKPVNHDRRPA